MTPSNPSIILGILTLLLLASPSAATDELATPADVAQLASREKQLRTEVDDRLSAWVVTATKGDSQMLAVHTTELLRQRTLLVARQDPSPPPAKAALTNDYPATRVEPSGNTTCTAVGHTLECVLRDTAAR